MEEQPRKVQQSLEVRQALDAIKLLYTKPDKHEVIRKSPVKPATKKIGKNDRKMSR